MQVVRHAGLAGMYRLDPSRQQLNCLPVGPRPSLLPPQPPCFCFSSVPCSDCAWGEDELQPLSCTGVHWLNLSLTMVDSLDTLYLLGMRREFEEAAE